MGFSLGSQEKGSALMDYRYWLRILYPQHLEPELFQILDFFFFDFQNTCIYLMRYLGDGNKVETQNLFMFQRHLIHTACR